MSGLASIDLFTGFSPEKLETLKNLCVNKTYPKNTVIINEGDRSDSLYIIETGHVKVYLSDEDGKEFLLNEMNPGDFFGELAVLDDDTRSASVMTQEKTTVSILYKKDFNDILTKEPELAFLLIRNLTKRIRALTDNIKALALKDVYGRVKQTLETLAVEAGSIWVIERKPTQQDIAQRVGASREMVARILKDLSVGGYIATEGKQMNIIKKLPDNY